jgi:PEP-CTERM motif
MSMRTIRAHDLLGAAALAVLLGVSLPASAGVTYKLNATNVTVDIPTPLFTSTDVSGSVEIADSVGPGGNFFLSDIESFAFDIGGYQFTKADLDPNPALTQFFNGMLSADGNSFASLDAGFSLDPMLPGCSLACDAGFNIGSQSIFVVGDDPFFETFGDLLFDVDFERVPEPMTLAVFGAGLAGALAFRRRKAAKV